MNKFKEGWDFVPWLPYHKPLSRKIAQALCNGLHLHYPSEDGSWVQGGFVCGRCNMNVFDGRKHVPTFAPPEVQEYVAEAHRHTEP